MPPAILSPRRHFPQIFNARLHASKGGGLFIAAGFGNQRPGDL
jgi:hypothetical protein